MSKEHSVGVDSVVEPRVIRIVVWHIEKLCEANHEQTQNQHEGRNFERNSEELVKQSPERTNDSHTEKQLHKRQEQIQKKPKRKVAQIPSQADWTSSHK